MIIIVQTFSAILLVAGSAAVLYYWFLALASYRPKAESPPDAMATWAFAIVIPAHNEEGTLASTIASCHELDYPKDLVGIFVVADNCTDRTATVAREHGAFCLERQDTSRRGKGFALEFGFSQIDFTQYEAVVVLDADCRIDSHALLVFNRYLQGGVKVLQANYIVSNPDDSPISYALAVGNCLENDLFYAPKFNLGLAVFLRGTGMVFHRDVLRQFPWAAYSITEDIEYAITLLRHGYRIGFVQEAAVRSPFPVDPHQLSVQRTRWAGGNLGFGKKHALLLMRDGLRLRNWMLVDAGATFLVLSRPLVIFALGLAFCGGGASYLASPGLTSEAVLTLTVVMFMLLGLYFLLGILRLGLTKKRIKYLCHIPFVVGRLIEVSLLGMVGFKANEWARTPR